jgi:hypothetical protein
MVYSICSGCIAHIEIGWSAGTVLPVLVISTPRTAAAHIAGHAGCRTGRAPA